MLLRPPALLAVSILLGCGCGDVPVPDAGRDAGVDAGDAGYDAGVDAGHDSGTDAGRDAGGPAWVRLPGFPDECAMERADNPQALYRPVWTACEEQPVGCLREVPANAIRTAVGWHDGERGYVFMAGGVNRIVDLDRGTIAAWRAPRPVSGSVCNVMVMGFGAGYAAVYMIYRNFRVEGRNLDHLYHAPIDEIGGANEPAVVISPGLVSLPQELGVTSEVVSAEMQGLTVLFQDGRFQALRGDPVVGTAQRMNAVGEFAFWADFGGTVRIAYGSFDQPAAFLRDISPGRIRGFQTDGVDFAWVEIFDSPPSLELYTAPVVFDAADLEPRRVGPITGIQFNEMGGGWYARVLADPERIVLTDLASGRTKTWYTAEDEVITGYDPTYVSATEVLLRGRRRGVRGSYYIRVDPRELPWDE